MKELRELLEEKRRQIQQLQQDVDALQRAVEIMSTPKGDAPGSVNSSTKTRKRRARRKAESSVKTVRTRESKKSSKLSVPDAAEQILQAADGPLHVTEIATRVADMGIKTRPAAVSTALQRYVRLGRRFKRPAPNTFALA